VIFDEGFLTLALDAPVSDCRAAVLVLVCSGYFISPVPAISGEHYPVRHRGEAPDGRLAPPYMFREWKREDSQNRL
jgi:hypothetical protein